MRTIRAVVTATVSMEISVPDWLEVDELAMANETSANTEQSIREQYRGAENLTLRDVTATSIVLAP